MTKSIILFGAPITIAFNLGVELAFEDIAGEAISWDLLKKSKNQVALWIACIIANNPESPIVAKSNNDLFTLLTREATRKELENLSNAVNECMLDWYRIPPTVAESQKRENIEQKDEEEEGAPSKN